MKQTFRPILTCLTLLALIFSAPGPVAAAAVADSLQAQQTSPEELLNADGTLNLNGTFQGALDLAGWNVQIDPERGPIFAPELAAPGQWANVGVSTNGALNSYVKAIAVSGTDIYVGGSFTNVSNNGTILPAGDYIAKWNGSTWSTLGSNGAGDGSLNNIVNAIAVNGTDVYIGGYFTDVNNNGTVLPAADRIAKWDTLTGNWSMLGSNGAGDGSLNYSVQSIAVSGTNVYAGGEFENVNNNGTILTAADHIAKWDTLTGNWSALGSNGAGNGSLTLYFYHVSAIAVSGTDVYIGGYFMNVNNNGTVLPEADYIAKWDGSNWSALGSNGAGNGSFGGEVDTIAVSGTDVYVGGWFTDINNNGTVLTAADYIAKWNGTKWSTLGSNGDGNGSLHHIVRSIVVNGTNIYVGGYFADVNNNGTVLPAADHIAKWNTMTGNWSGVGSSGAGNGSLNSYVAAISISGTNVFVGGGFTDLKKNGTYTAAIDYIAQWNGSTWSALSSSGVDGSFGRGRVRAVVISGTDVYVGGGFTDVSNNGVAIPTADYVAKWNGTKWSALGSNGSGNGALNGDVYAIAVSGADVYVGGYFKNITNNGTVLYAADYIAKWDGTNWSALGSNSVENGSLNSYVRAITIRGTDVYVGGNFTDVKNNKMLRAADYIAKWDGSNWSALGSNGAGDGSIPYSGFYTSINAIAVSGANIYVGGDFTNVNNNGTILPAADYIAKWNGTSWSALGSNGAGDGSLNNTVNALAVSGTNLYVGGAFTNVNKNGTVLPAADYITKWNGTNWSALGSNGAGNGSLNKNVATIVVNGSSVFVGGEFTDVNNNGAALPAADFVAKWTGTSWLALGSNGAGNGSLKYDVNALAVSGTNLYVGGAFINLNNKGTVLPAADHIAAYGLGAVPTATPSASPSPTKTITKTMTATQTPTQTVGASSTITVTPSPTETLTETPTEAITATETPTPSPTETETETPTVTPTP